MDSDKLQRKKMLRTRRERQSNRSNQHLESRRTNGDVDKVLVEIGFCRSLMIFVLLKGMNLCFFLIFLKLRFAKLFVRRIKKIFRVLNCDPGCKRSGWILFDLRDLFWIQDACCWGDCLEFWAHVLCRLNRRLSVNSKMNNKVDPYWHEKTYVKKVHFGF